MSNFIFNFKFLMKFFGIQKKKKKKVQQQTEYNKLNEFHQNKTDLVFSDILERNNDYSDTLDFSRG